MALSARSGQGSEHMTMAAQSLLRRWKKFFPTFDATDAAVDASGLADELQSVRELQRVSGKILDILWDASEDGAAEECLDECMVEYLIVLQSVPVTPSALASTDLAKAVAGLGEHESARIRGFARGVVRGWRASVESDLAKARAAIEELDKISDEKLPYKTVAHAHEYHVPVVSHEEEKKRPPKESSQPKAASVRVEPAKSAAPRTKNLAQLSKKMMPPVVGRAAGDERAMRPGPQEKMEATKRKLHEGYQEAVDAKRQRKIQVIEAPKLVEQRQWKMHPIMRQRSQARLASSTAMRRSLMPSFQRV